MSNSASSLSEFEIDLAAAQILASLTRETKLGDKQAEANPYARWFGDRTGFVAEFRFGFRSPTSNKLRGGPDLPAGLRVTFPALMTDVAFSEETLKQLRRGKPHADHRGIRQAGFSAGGADHRQNRAPRHIRQTRHDGLLASEGGRACRSSQVKGTILRSIRDELQSIPSPEPPFAPHVLFDALLHPLDDLLPLWRPQTARRHIPAISMA
jgi:hypothetical protein